jgi:hypothetical protein
MTPFKFLPSSFILEQIKDLCRGEWVEVFVGLEEGLLEECGIRAGSSKRESQP